eukprot:scaffold1581_cov342-Prasinococcus_capsulatus_cf.AAC.16
MLRMLRWPFTGAGVGRFLPPPFADTTGLACAASLSLLFMLGTLSSLLSLGLSLGLLESEACRLAITLRIVCCCACGCVRRVAGSLCKANGAGIRQALLRLPAVPSPQLFSSSTMDTAT